MSVSSDWGPAICSGFGHASALSDGIGSVYSCAEHPRADVADFNLVAAIGEMPGQLNAS
jgi:hypothetical protein